MAREGEGENRIGYERVELLLSDVRERRVVHGLDEGDGTHLSKEDAKKGCQLRVRICDSITTREETHERRKIVSSLGLKLRSTSESIDVPERVDATRINRRSALLDETS